MVRTLAVVVCWSAPLLLSLAAVACSPASVAPPDAGVDAGPGVSTACSSYAAARCSRFQECSPTVIELRYGTEAACRAAFAQACINADTAPSTGSSPATGAACSQALAGWDCADYIDNTNPPPACATSMGSVASGGVCGVNQQCQTGFCSIPVGRGCGTCAPQPTAGVTCASIISCGAGLVCETATNSCASYSQESEACSSTQPCATGLNCVIPTGGTSGTCQVAATSPGAMCTPGGPECDFYAGLSCNTSTMMCASVQFASPGQPCAFTNNQSVSCSSGAKCVAGTGGAPATCQQIAAAGGACDLMAGPFCPELTHCVTTTDGGTSGSCQYSSASLCN